MTETGNSMSPKPITENTLFYGDNLDILREQWHRAKNTTAVRPAQAGAESTAV